jgi:hypothetical protein
MTLLLKNLFATIKEKFVTIKIDVPKTPVTQFLDVSLPLIRLLLDAILLSANKKPIVLHGQPKRILLTNAKMQFVTMKPRLAELF